MIIEVNPLHDILQQVFSTICCFQSVYFESNSIKQKKIDKCRAVRKIPGLKWLNFAWITSGLPYLLSPITSHAIFPRLLHFIWLGHFCFRRRGCVRASERVALLQFISISIAATYCIATVSINMIDTHYCRATRHFSEAYPSGCLESAEGNTHRLTVHSKFVIVFCPISCSRAISMRVSRIECGMADIK